MVDFSHEQAHACEITAHRLPQEVPLEGSIDFRVELV